MSLHNRYAVEVPRNIFSIYDCDDYYDGYNDYYDYDDYDVDYCSDDEVFVITDNGVFITDSGYYYKEVIIDEDFELQDVLREEFVVCDNIKREVVNKHPEYFV